MLLTGNLIVYGRTISQVSLQFNDRHGCLPRYLSGDKGVIMMSNGDRYEGGILCTASNVSSAVMHYSVQKHGEVRTTPLAVRLTEPIEGTSCVFRSIPLSGIFSE